MLQVLAQVVIVQMRGCCTNDVYIYFDIQLRTARVKTSQALLSLKVIKLG